MVSYPETLIDPEIVLLGRRCKVFTLYQFPKKKSP